MMLTPYSLQIYSESPRLTSGQMGTCFAIENPYGKNLFITNAHVACHVEDNPLYKFWLPAQSYTWGKHLFINNGYGQRLKAKPVAFEYQHQLEYCKHLETGYNYTSVISGVDIAILEVENMPHNFIMTKLTLVPYTSPCVVHVNGFSDIINRFYTATYMADKAQGYILQANREMVQGTSGAPITNHQGDVLAMAYAKISTSTMPVAFHKIEDKAHPEISFVYSHDDLEKTAPLIYGLATPSQCIIDLLIKTYGYY